MDQQRVDMFLTANRNYFPPDKFVYLRERMLYMPDDRFPILSSVELKDPTTLLLVSIFLGYLGVDRFMIGDVGMGVLKLLTAGVCGILAIYDWCTISNKVRELNFNNIMAYLQ